MLNKSIHDVLNSGEELLFHYTTMKKAKLILPSGRLKFSSFGEFDDPTESSYRSFMTVVNGIRGYESDVYAVQDSLNEIILSRAKAFCFTKDIEKPLSTAGPQSRRGYAKARMWSQYGDKYRGVCLIFSKQKIENIIEKKFSEWLVHKGDVKYIPDFISGTPNFISRTPNLFMEVIIRMGVESYVTHIIEKYYPRLFFEKLDDYKDENEFRIILLSREMSNEQEEELFIQYEDALLGVLIGDGSTIEERLSLKSFQSQCPVGIVWWCVNDFDVLDI